MVWVVDVLGFLLLCVGSKLAMPRVLRLLCRIAALYVFVFTIGYYFWLLAKFHHFKTYPHDQTSMTMAFTFEGFWHLLGNMVLLQTLLPSAIVLILFLGIKWLLTGPGSGYRR